jgi:8-oxo-dGTP diphosphatase
MNDVICTVDVVLLTLKNDVLHVALLKRDREPFAGTMALPGGFIHADEDRDDYDAACRILREKTGIVSPYLEQLGTFAGAARDPRGWSASIAYYALVPEEVIASTPQAGVKLVPVDGLKGLPFDHQRIVETAVARVRSKSTYSSLPVYFVGEEFTLPRLREVYKVILREPINNVSFLRKMTELDMVEPVEGAFVKTGGKPAQLYRLKPEFRGALSVTNRGFNANS